MTIAYIQQLCVKKGIISIQNVSVEHNHNLLLPVNVAY